MNMPTDTQRAPLSAAIEKERALVQPFAHATTAKKISRILADMDTARAATDEAVKAVEALLTECANVMMDGQADMKRRVLQREIREFLGHVPATTGGASDE